MNPACHVTTSRESSDYQRRQLRKRTPEERRRTASFGHTSGGSTTRRGARQAPGVEDTPRSLSSYSNVLMTPPGAIRGRSTAGRGLTTSGAPPVPRFPLHRSSFNLTEIPATKSIGRVTFPRVVRLVQPGGTGWSSDRPRIVSGHSSNSTVDCRSRAGRSEPSMSHTLRAPAVETCPFRSTRERILRFLA